MLTAWRSCSSTLRRVTRSVRYFQLPARSLHSVKGLPQSTDIPEAYVSLSTDPWFNLSLEHFLFTSRDPQTPVCLLYRNRPCVVVGRNQNPWKEVDSKSLHELDIPLVRRRSGGGTVYHDLGNTNYSFHVPRASFARHVHADLVVRALNSPPIGLASDSSGGAYINSRNDICVRVPSRADTGDQWSERKVSGSAYKLVSARAYHHGTMLLSASLSSLGDALHNKRGDSLVTKGVASVRSSVINLADAFPQLAQQGRLTHEAFVQSVVEEFASTYAASASTNFNASSHTANLADRTIESHTIDEVLMDSTPELRRGYEELRSWEWTHGQTPEFSHTLPSLPFEWNGDLSRLRDAKIIVHSRHGVITDVELSPAAEPARGSAPESPQDEALKHFLTLLRGRHYDDLAFAPPDGEGVREPSKLRLGGKMTSPWDAPEANTEAAIARTVEHDLLQWFKTVL